MATNTHRRTEEDIEETEEQSQVEQPQDESDDGTQVSKVEEPALPNGAKPHGDTASAATGYDVGRNVTKANGGSATNTSSASNEQTNGTSTTTGSSDTNNSQHTTYNWEVQKEALQHADELAQKSPSGYQDYLKDEGYVSPEGRPSNALQEKLDAGVPFSKAIQELALENDAEAKAKAEKLAKTRNTMANAMEAFRLASDIGSGFAGGNIYKREGNDDIVAQNNADVAAANTKYQKAVDDFNDRMNKLKDDDLTQRRKIYNDMLEVGKGSEGKSHSSNNSSTTNNSNKTSSSTSSSATVTSQNSTTDQNYENPYESSHARALAKVYTDAAGAKKVELSHPVVDQNGKITGYERTNITEQEYNNRKSTALSLLRELANSPKASDRKMLSDIAMNMGWKKEDGTYDTDKVIKVLTGKMSEKDDENGQKIDYAQLQDDILMNYWYRNDLLREIMVGKNTQGSGHYGQGQRVPGSSQTTAEGEGPLG